MKVVAIYLAKKYIRACVHVGIYAFCIFWVYSLSVLFLCYPIRHFTYFNVKRGIEIDKVWNKVQAIFFFNVTYRRLVGISLSSVAYLI